MKRFQVYNTMCGETVAVIEMDEKLLQPEANILDPDTLTLRPLKKFGAIYTLYPLDDPLLDIIQRIRLHYETVTQNPTKALGDYIANIDGLIGSLASLFDKSTAILVESAEDLQNIIHPPNDYEPKEMDRDLYEELVGAIKLSQITV